MAMIPSDWPQYVQPFGTLVTGIAAAMIAFVQWRTARTKLLLDLHDRRMTAIADIHRVIDEILKSQNETIHYIHAQRYIAKAKLLFGSDVCAHLDKLDKEVSNLLSLILDRRDNENINEKYQQNTYDLLNDILESAKKSTRSAEVYLKLDIKK